MLDEYISFIKVVGRLAYGELSVGYVLCINNRCLYITTLNILRQVILLFHYCQCQTTTGTNSIELLLR